MRYASVCSGIEAASVAWSPLGWRAAWLSEIEPFPCAVLAHHYPDVPNLGDMTKITEDQLEQHGPIELLVGGTPCQSFSVAGLRKGLDDPRGNLALRFLQLAGAARPRWVVWENVPGVLSSGNGRDFGTFLGALGQLGYGFAYRVLDAQFFGLAQRRRRVFVVGCLGDWRRAAAVLFERHCLSGHPAPSREAGPGVAALTANGVGTCGADDNQGQAGHLIGVNSFGETDIGTSLNAHGQRLVPDTETFVARAVTPILEAGKRCGTRNDARDGIGVGTPGDPMFTLQSGAQHAVAFDCKATDCQPGDVSPTMRSMSHDKSHANAGGQVAVAFNWQAGGSKAMVGGTNPYTDATPANQIPAAQIGMSVRRLTPTECERLQGFPDGYTNVPYRGKPASDGPRYKALGNSMAVPVMRWIGERIAQVDALALEQKGAA